MSHELNEGESTGTLDTDSPDEIEDEDREAYGSPRAEREEIDRQNTRCIPDRKGFEYIDGKWIEKPMSMKSALVGMNISGRLFIHVLSHPSGLLFNGDASYRLPNLTNRIRKPDLSFVAADRLPPSRDEDGSWPIAPDLAVEVISPSEIAEEIETKLDEYLRAGVRLSWLVYIPTRNVWAYKADGTARLFRATEVLTGDDVLPGFSIPVADLFEGL